MEISFSTIVIDTATPSQLNQTLQQSSKLYRKDKYYIRDG